MSVNLNGVEYANWEEAEKSLPEKTKNLRAKNIANGVVMASEVLYPKSVGTEWFKVWAMRCGHCNTFFARFAFFGRPKCPECGVRNDPNFHPMLY